MEAHVLDSKNFFIRTLNVDTRFRSNYSGTSATDFTYHLPNPLKNIIRLRLTSCEIPNTEYVFSCKKYNTSFKIIDVNATSTITIPSGNYTKAQLISQIQGQLTPLTGSYTITINDVGKTIIASPTLFFTLDFTQPPLARRKTNWGIGYDLGYRTRVYEGGKSYVSDTFMNVDGEAYYFLEIEGANGMNSRGIDDSNLDVFTKIIIDKSKTMIVFDNNSQMFRREFVYQQPTNIPQLRIRLLDAYGQVVNLNGADYSMTFEVTEITDIKDYRKFTSREGGQTNYWGSAIHAAMA